MGKSGGRHAPSPSGNQDQVDEARSARRRSRDAAFPSPSKDRPSESQSGSAPKLPLKTEGTPTTCRAAQPLSLLSYSGSAGTRPPSRRPVYLTHAHPCIAAPVYPTAHTHTHERIHLHAYANARTHERMHARTHACTCTHALTRACACTRACARVRTHTSTQTCHAPTHARSQPRALARKNAGSRVRIHTRTQPRTQKFRENPIHTHTITS